MFSLVTFAQLLTRLEDKDQQSNKSVIATHFISLRRLNANLSPTPESLFQL